MTSSQAYKYADVFEMLSEPKILILLDYLREERGYESLTLIAKEARISESKARSYCERLERKSILDEENIDGQPHYKMVNSGLGNRVEDILEQLD